MKKLFILLFSLGLFISAGRADYSTPGTGIIWNLDSLTLYSSGAVTGAGGVFTVNQSVVFTAPDRLELQPGDSLIFADQSGTVVLEIQGELVAAGNDSQRIVITSQQQNYGDYGGIELRNSSPEDATQLKYCTIEYAKNGLKIVDASPVVENCTVQHTSRAAIDLFDSDASILNCRIYHNQQYALKMTYNSSPLVENNYFAENNFENSSPYVIITVGLQGLNSPVIRGNTIIGGYEKSGGISVWGQSNALIEENEVRNCAYGIFCYQAGASPLIRNNTLLDNNINPDTLYFGFGIACNGANQPVISGNTIQGNFYGVAVINGAQPNLGNLANADTTDDGGNRFLGNGIENRRYELFNNNSLPLTAEGNWWGTGNPDSIEARIVHQPDNPAYGLVDYQPYLIEDPLSIRTPAAELPAGIALSANYPNPFNSGTVIPFTLNRRQRITLTIYDVLGRKVRTLADKEFTAGSYRIHWDGTNADGTDAGSGLYFYRLQSGASQAAGRMLLVR